MIAFFASVTNVMGDTVHPGQLITLYAPDYTSTDTYSFYWTIKDGSTDITEDLISSDSRNANQISFWVPTYNLNGGDQDGGTTKTLHVDLTVSRNDFDPDQCQGAAGFDIEVMPLKLVSPDTTNFCEGGTSQSTTYSLKRNNGDTLSPTNGFESRWTLNSHATGHPSWILQDWSGSPDLVIDWSVQSYDEAEYHITAEVRYVNGLAPEEWPSVPHADTGNFNIHKKPEPTIELT